MQASIKSPFFKTNFLTLKIGANGRLVDHFDLLWGSSYTTRISRDPKQHRYDSNGVNCTRAQEDDTTSDKSLPSVTLQYRFSDAPRTVKLEFLKPIPPVDDDDAEPPTDDQQSKEEIDEDSWCDYDESARSVLQEVTLWCGNFDFKKKLWRGTFVVEIGANTAEGDESDDYSTVDLKVTLFGSLSHDELGNGRTPPRRHGKYARRLKTPRAPKKFSSPNLVNPKFPAHVRRRLFK